MNMKGFYRVAHETVRVLDRSFYYPETETVEGFEGVEEVVCVDDRTLINFASNGYLGLARHPKVIEAAQKALVRYGLGTGGSRLTSGSQKPHRELEEAIASFKDTEDAVVFSSGYLTNIGAITALSAQPLRLVVETLDTDAMRSLVGQTQILVDKLSHMSIVDGVMLAGSRFFGNSVSVRFYQHNDTTHLESLLKNSSADRKLIVTDGVFSLHGRVAPLDEILRIAHAYDAQVYVDDAHGTGVLGKHGRGTAELFGVDGLVDFSMGTLSKALGGQGGYIACTSEVCRYLRVAARSYMFQTSMPAAIAAGVTAALGIVQAEPERRERLLSNAKWLNSELINMGLETFGSTTQIVPVCFYDEGSAKRAYRILLDRGIFAPCYYYPAVPRNESIIRVNLTAMHTRHQIECLLEAISEAAKETDISCNLRSVALP